MKIIFRIILVLAGLAVLVSLFYAEEDWRGKRAWEKCKAELEAKGETLDWNAYIPAPVPDDRNFFQAPKMQEWFVENWHSHTNEWVERFDNKKFKAATVSVSTATNLIKTADAAKDYLAWSDPFESDFNLIREALKRPYARIYGDYGDPIMRPTFNFTSVRALAQILAQRANCYLVLGQPEKALDELTLFNDSRRLLEAAPAGKPTTLVAAIIDVAVTGLYVNIIADGLQLHAWREPQLIAFQEQLKSINLAPAFAKSFDFESTVMVWTLKSFFRKYPHDPSLWQDLEHFRFPWGNWVYQIIVAPKIMPSGWVYQNMVTAVRMNDKQRDGFDFESGIILPTKMESSQVEIRNALKHSSPYNFFVVMIDADPNFLKGWQTTAHNQTLANEAQIACTLERYHFAHGAYPETLGALTPQFIGKIPHDIIGGQPLHYRRTDDGKFLLYSVGWNEKDDGGAPGTLLDVNHGDWVWQYPLK